MYFLCTLPSVRELRSTNSEEETSVSSAETNASSHPSSQQDAAGPKLVWWLQEVSSATSSHHLALVRNILQKPSQIGDNSIKLISFSLSDLVYSTLFCSVNLSTLEVIVYYQT